MIEKNTTIPTRKSQVFSTAADNQTAVTIHVLQGEREFAEHNKSLGRFDLVGIPPARRGVPQVEVTFDIDANGIVHVSAKDLGTGKEQSIRITAASGLSAEEIERMKKEAELHRAEDEKRKELVDARNVADQVVYAAEKAIKDNGEKAGAEIVKEVQDKIDALKTARGSEDSATIKSATDALSSTLSKIGEAMMKNTPPPAGQAGAEGGGPEGSAEGAKDAEFKEKP